MSTVIGFHMLASFTKYKIGNWEVFQAERVHYFAGMHASVAALRMVRNR